MLFEIFYGDNNSEDDRITTNNLFELGRSVLGSFNAKNSAPEMIITIQVKIIFTNGLNLVVVHNLISKNRDLELAL